MLLADDSDDLSGVFKMTLTQLAQQLASLDDSIALFDQAIIQTSKNKDVCKRLQSIPGIGPMVSSALFNEVGNGSACRKGRDVSASLGLVPKQHSSGGKDVVLGISKKGNCYLRCLLVQGSQSVVTSAKRKNDKLSQWAPGAIQVFYLKFRGGYPLLSVCSFEMYYFPKRLMKIAFRNLGSALELFPYN
jgi:transposase